MGIADLLGLGGVQGASPMIPQMADQTAGIDAALTRNQQIQPPKPQGRHGSPIRDLLGTLGDFLLVRNGMAPLYHQKQEQRREEERRAQMGSALAQYLGAGDPNLAAIFAADPDAGLAVYKATHQQADEPAGVREFNAYNKMQGPDKQAFENYLRLTHPGMGAPLTIPENATVEMPGHSGGDVPTVNSVEEYDALPPGAHYRDSQGNPGVKGGLSSGGPTASPSVPFP